MEESESGHGELTGKNKEEEEIVLVEGHISSFTPAWH